VLFDGGFPAIGMKPSTTEAMQQLIKQLRQVIPFELAMDDVCNDDCRGCSVKLLEYLQSEIDSWEYRLQQQQIPDFRDLTRLQRSGRKIYATMQRNGLINGDDREDN